jgi:hypothetical protein
VTFRFLAADDLFLVLGRAETAGHHAHVVSPGGQPDDRPVPFTVGLGSPDGSVGGAHEHFGSRERRVRIRDFDGAFEIAPPRRRRSGRCAGVGGGAVFSTGFSVKS